MGYLTNALKSFKLKYAVTYFALIAFTVLMIILSSAGVLSRLGIGLLSRFAYSIIMALSLNLVVGFLGELSLGHAGFMCIGAYIGCYCANLCTTRSAAHWSC